jgi:adenylate kinase
MIILVSGIDDSGRDEIIELVTAHYKSLLPRCKLIKANDFLPDFSTERSVKKLASMRDNSTAKMQSSVIAALKKGANVIVSSSLTKTTIHGYLPVITEEFVDSLKPDFILFMEIVPGHAQAYMEHEHIDWSHQRMERHFASLFSLRTGALLRVLRIRPGNVKGAIKECADALRAGMA